MHLLKFIDLWFCEFILYTSLKVSWRRLASIVFYLSNRLNGFIYLGSLSSHTIVLGPVYVKCFYTVYFVYLCHFTWTTPLTLIYFIVIALLNVNIRYVRCVHEKVLVIKE